MTLPALVIPRLIGHRGAKANAPENTLAAFRQAREEGATWVEFDVRLTKDDVPVVIHDKTLDRTTDGHGRVRETTLAAIKRLDAGRWFAPEFKGERVPTLAEALDCLATLDMGFNLEIKRCSGLERETTRLALELVARRWPPSRSTPVISSFDHDALAEARTVAPDLPRGYLAESLSPRWRATVDALDCRTVHPNWRGLSRRRIAEVKAAGYPLLVWTVNEGPRARELIGYGVDALITDRPGDLRAALGGPA
jgi:glycerophosphoryl diester phosphodiesterase